MLNLEIVLDLLLANLKPLRPWLDNKNVTEIMINPGGHVFVEESGVITFVGQLLTESMIEVSLKAIGKMVGQDTKKNTISSVVNASIDDLRIAGALKPVCPAGSFMTIRKHHDKSERPDLETLVKWGMITERQAELLLNLIVERRLNCLIGGGTGSGKTTLLGAILNRLPKHERIMSIEDSREMQIDIPNYVPLLTNPDHKITARDMVKLAMRSRPDRLILGETRGDETYDVIRAFNSGHPGSITTIHGDSAEESLGALEMLYQMSLPDNASISAELARGYIAKAVKLAVFVNRSINVVDGVARVVRRVEEICIVKGVVNGKYDLEPVT
jgi:Flp pilus assembly CpaF family ATPase